MERRALGFLAIILIGLMAIVATAGLDDLPSSLRNASDSASALLTQDRSTFDENRSQVERAMSERPVLFQAEAAAWKSRLDEDRAKLDAAAQKLAAAQQLAKANRRVDGYYIESDLGESSQLRQNALRDSSEVRSEVDRWLAAERELPARIQAMRASNESLQAVNPDVLSGPVANAMVDWPAKREDLQARLDSIKQLKIHGQAIWESSAKLRSSAEAKSLADSDVSALLSQADELDTTARQASANLTATNALASQLYVAWDKLLLDIDHGRDPREKVRIVRTRFPDATLAHGETTSEDRWESLDSLNWRDAEDNTGMVIEQKPAGKYDSESERSVQPPAYAHIAPPGQANSYGSWSGGVWHWLPEYLILSQLLHASRLPITTSDYESYQNARRSGEIFTGRDRGVYVPRRPMGSGSGDRASSIPSNSPSGGWSKERPQSSSSQGYSGSRYRSQGTFSGSQYRSRGTFGSSGGARSYARSRGGRR
jgi:hypothetical protein